MRMSSGYKTAGIFTKLLHLTSCASLVNLLKLPKITSWEIDGETVETISDFIFLGSKITADGDYSHEIKRCLLIGRNVMNNLGSILKRRDITLLNRSIYSRLWFFQWSCMDVRVELLRELRADKLMLLNLVLEKSLKRPLDCKDIQPVHPKGDQSWVFIGRTDAEAEIQYFSHLM